MTRMRRVMVFASGLAQLLFETGHQPALRVKRFYFVGVSCQ
jgi:hypothetical protein